MLRHHVLSKLRNHKLLNLKVKFNNVSSEQEFVSRNPKKYTNLIALIKQVAFVT